MACLRMAMDGLSPANRDMVGRYYLFERREKIEERTRLADGLGITVAALAVRLHRLRNDLRKLVEDCVESASARREPRRANWTTGGGA
jgi:DNA-directed RNA polymerase specialized sigma24 family protein